LLVVTVPGATAAAATNATKVTDAARAQRAAKAASATKANVASCPWLNPLVSIQQRVDELVAAMTPAQEVSLMQPVKGGPYPGYEHYVPGIPSLCVPAVMQQDGPAGVATGATGVTQLPAPIAAASTFDTGVASQYGSVVGNEMRGKGIGFALAPTLNLDRVPQWGRSFETLGEDTYLTTRLGDSMIEGIQSQGVIANVKHYAEYNQETYREPAAKDNVIASVRTMQETELSIFGSAVRDAHAGAVMCAMPAVNGTGACENSYLLGVLRNQYGFKGDIRSDNPPSVTSDSKAVNAGLDQAVAPAFNASDLLAALADGQISRTELNGAAGAILYPMFQAGLFDNPLSGSLGRNVSTGAHVSFAQSSAAEGTVLLRNSGGVLPLDSHSLSSIAVIGADANAYAETGGGGGSLVRPGHVVTPLAGIKDRAGAGVKVTYTMGNGPYDELPDIPSADLTPDHTGGAQARGLTAKIYSNATLSGTPAVTRTDPTVDVESPASLLPGMRPASQVSMQWTGTLHPPATGGYQFSLTCDVSCSLFINGKRIINDGGASAEQTRQTATGGTDLTAGQSAQIKVTYEQTPSATKPRAAGAIAQLGWMTPDSTPTSVAEAAAAAQSAQVAVVFAGMFESEGYDQPNLGLSAADNQLISAVAAANPHTIVVLNTGGPVLMPWLDKVAGVVEAWYPGQKDGSAIASVLFGDTDPGGKLPVTFPASASQPLSADQARFPGTGGNVHYSEGLDIGYKWYAARGLTPLFPFGYGLSYTTFGFSGLSVTPASGTPDPNNNPNQVVATVQAQVTNTGSRAGAEVAQLYLGDPSSTGEPARQLRGFQRVQLAPGQSAQVSFGLTAQDLAYWNNSWTVASGTYKVWVGDSSATSGLPLSGSFQMP